MPTFYSRGATVRLHTTDLTNVTVENPVSDQTASKRKYLDKATKELEKSVGAGSWREIAAPCESGGHVQFLGENRDMPFIMVQASLNLKKPARTESERSSNHHGHFSPSRARSTSISPHSPLNSAILQSEHRSETSPNASESAHYRGYHENAYEGSTLSSDEAPLLNEWQSQRQDLNAVDGPESSELSPVSTSNDSRSVEGIKGHEPEHVIDSIEPQAPKGICLSVELSRNTFLEHPYSKTDLKFMDVKIDVYFNGHLCSSAYCARRNLRADQKTMLQYFSGCRVKQVWEKPWIVRHAAEKTQVSPDIPKEDTDVDGFLGTLRWTDIGTAIRREAGTTSKYEDGELGILGDYLTSLADLPIPNEIKRLQKGTEFDFGVIDVVVTGGVGGKDAGGNPCISGPEALRIMRWQHYQQTVTPRSAVPRLLSVSSRTLNQSKPRLYGDQRLIQENAAELGLRQSSRAVTRQSSTFGVSGTASPQTIKLAMPVQRRSNAVGSSDFRSELPKISANPYPTASTRRLPGVGTTSPSPRPSRSPVIPKNIPQKCYRGSEPELEPDPTQKRGRMGYVVVVDDKLTEEEKYRAIISKTEKGKVPETYATRSILSELPSTLKDTKENSPQAESAPRTKSRNVPSTPQTLTPSADNHSRPRIPVLQNKETPGKVSVLKYRKTTGGLGPTALSTNTVDSPSTVLHQQSPLRRSTIASTSLLKTSPSARSSSVLSTDLTSLPSVSPQPPNATSNENSDSGDVIMEDTDADTTLQVTEAVSPEKDDAMDIDTPTPRSVSGKPHSRYKIPEKEWKMPELSEDCVVSFGEGVRQIRRERPGWFEEHSLLCGFRFLIGA